MKRFKLLTCILLLMSLALNTGFEFLNDPVELNPKEAMVYQSRTVEDALGDSQSGIKDTGYAVSAKISGIGKKYDSFKLVTKDGKEEIDCTTSVTDVKNTVAELSEGVEVTAYGTVKKKLIGKGLNMNVLLITKGKLKTGSGVYCTDSEHVFHNGNTAENRIVDIRANGTDTVSFRVPAEWKRVEKELDDKGDHIQGFQYRLNKLADRSIPESLYVFYFDYNKNLADKSQYDRYAGIEAAIVENILGKKDAGKCPESVIKSPYGVEYDYYDDKYEKGDEVFHLEFVFRKNGTKGMLVFMYIYRLPYRKDEIMYVMRSAEMK